MHIIIFFLQTRQPHHNLVVKSLPHYICFALKKYYFTANSQPSYVLVILVVCFQTITIMYILLLIHNKI